MEQHGPNLGRRRRIQRTLRHSLLCGGLLCTGLLAACSGGEHAGVAVAPRISIDEAMIDWINPASYAVWDAAREELQPQTEEDWHRLEQLAVQLVASGTWITLGGTGPHDDAWVREESWLDYSRSMTDAASAALDAARSRDLDAFVEAGNLLVDSCEGCHAEYRSPP